jgi:DNA-binding NarL/FixJ family response regulator
VDLSLPDYPGIELVERLRARGYDGRVLVASGQDERVYARRALDAGAQGYVMKGDAKEIVRAMHAVLDEGEYFSDAVRNGWI